MVVVGAGLAGLRAAQLLAAAGRDVVVLEAGDGIGGRVRTDRVDGFTLDRGFQLYNPAYPEGRAAWPALELRAFESGVEVVAEGGVHRLVDPRRELSGLRPTVRSVRALGVTRGAAALVAYVARLGTPARPRATPGDRVDQPIGEALAAAGVDRRTLDALVRPFLSGVLADAALTSPRLVVDEILRSFRAGTPGVPSQGMDELPRRLSVGLAIHARVPVISVAGGRVVTEEGQWQAGDVVLAVGDPLVLDGAPPVTWRALTTWYFASGPLPRQHRMLLVSPETQLANVAVISDVAPTYAPPGRSLVAASAVGYHDDTESLDRARRDAARMLGVAAGDLEPIAHYPIRHALPVVGTRQVTTVCSGVVLAGDHRAAPSINGALASGRRAARLLGA